MALNHRLHLTLTLGCLALAAAAEAPPPVAQPDAGSEFGDDLSQFDELPVVVSASRGKRQLTESPVPVSVVSGEDIRLGGYTTVAEALMFTPGMDVAPADRNHWMVGVRGLHEVYSDRTLTLVDGVVADNPLYGGSEFQRLPVLLGDLDHIEVVRGPGGAAWGANAFNGVVNLISALPEDTLGTKVGLTVNDAQDLAATARWGDFSGPVSWRVGVGYQHQSSSEDVLGEADPGDEYQPSERDDAERVTGTGDLCWHVGSTTDLRFGVGYAYNEEGSFETLGVSSEHTARHRLARATAAIDQGLSEATSLRVTAYGNYQDSYDYSLLDYQVGECGSEAQVDVEVGGGHRLSIGGGARITHIETVDHDDPEQFTFDGVPITETRFGLFVIDHWQVTDPFSLESQVRGDHYSGTGTDWAGRLSGIYAVDDDRDHLLRLGVARAYRTPLVSIRDAHTDRIFVAPGVALVHFDGRELDNEHTWIGELGWSSRLDPGVLLRIDGFYQRYDDLIGYTVDSPSPPINAVPETLGSADMWGIETEVAYANAHGRWSVWYAWHDFETEHEDQSVRAFGPTTSAVGATSRWNLPLHLIGVINYRFSDIAEATENDLDAFHRLDVALTWRPTGNHGELGAGCHDVLNEDHDVDLLGSFSKGTVPGRIFFVRGELTF